MLSQYRSYLIQRGLKEFSAQGNKSSVWDYSARLTCLMRREGITLDTLSREIGSYIQMYSRGGEKYMIGRQGHESVINSLRQFKKFIESEQKPGALSIFRFGSSK